MLRNNLRQFLDDERGSYTIWSLVWFILYVAVGGLAVDGTDAYNKQTLLQATADAAALAGVMSLPDEVDAVDQALAFAANNMKPEVNGLVLKPTDVYIGNWNSDTETFTITSGTDVNAVYVITRRSRDNGNPVVMSFLRILQLFGFDPRWDVVAEAVAVTYQPGCLMTNGLFAGNKVDFTSNNEFKDICIHGENIIDDPGHNYAIEIQNNGTIGENVQFSTPDTDDFTGLPTACSNDGLCTAGGDIDPQVLIEGDLMPLEAGLISDAINAFLNEQDSVFAPNYLYNSVGTESLLYPFETIDLDNCTQCTQSIDPETGETIYTYEETLDPGKIYLVKCDNQMTQFDLPDSNIQPDLVHVGVVSQCRIGGGQGMNITDSMLASATVGNGSKPYDVNGIHLVNVGRLGSETPCDPSGGVRLYSASSVKFTANLPINGAQIIAQGDIQFTANSTVSGISALAGNDITMTANNSFEYCPPGDEDFDVLWRYRLVR